MSAWRGCHNQSLRRPGNRWPSYFMPARGYKRCPICRKVITWEGNPDRPFCSERCRLIDLGNWAAEEYSLPAGESETHENDEQPNSAET